MASSVVEKYRRAFADYCAEVNQYEAKRLCNALKDRVERLFALRPLLMGNREADPTLHFVDAAILGNMLLRPDALELVQVDPRSSEPADIEHWLWRVCSVLALAMVVDFSFTSGMPLHPAHKETALAILEEFMNTAEELQRALRLFVVRWTPRFPTLRQRCVRVPVLHRSIMEVLERRVAHPCFDFINLELHMSKPETH